MIKNILFILVFFGIQVLSGYAEPPEPEVGERWVRNDQFSDEFDGTSLNFNKWNNTFDGWKGRQPAYFNPNCVNVQAGNLVIRNQPGVPAGAPSGYTMSGGAVQSKTQGAHFGYFECNFKSSRINMSTTFWLSTSKKDELRTSDNNDSYSQELDICESIGGAGNFSSDFRKKMKFNTHYRLRPDPGAAEIFYSRGNNQVEIRDGDLQGGDASLRGGTEAWEDFHTYGSYWKNANEASFFVDNDFIGVVKFRTDVVSDPFKDPMRINLVTETYNWAKPYPTNAQLNDNSINASYYNWVRTYVKLPVNQATTLDDEGTVIFEEMAAFREFNANVAANDQISFIGLYKANVDREVVISIRNNAGDVIGSKTFKALAGYGKANYVLNLNNVLSEGEYTANIELRNTNGNSISLESKSFTVGGVSLTPKVDFVSVPEVYITSTSIAFDVNYSTDVDRDLVLVLTSPSGNWLGSKTMTVASGSGTANLEINLSESPVAAEDYKISAILRAVGGDWTTNVVFKDIFVDFVTQEPCANDAFYNECFEENGHVSWVGWGTAVRELTNNPTHVYAGNYALKITGRGAGEYLVEGLESNQEYELKGFLKVLSASRVTLGVKAYNDLGEETFEFRTNTDYEELTLSFTTGANNTSAIIYFYSPEESGEGYLDNLSLKKGIITAEGNFNEGERLTIYPNPTNGKLHLPTTSTDWQVYNLSGEKVLETSETELDMSAYPKGLYLFRSGEFVQKVRVQ